MKFSTALSIIAALGLQICTSISWAVSPRTISTTPQIVTVSLWSSITNPSFPNYPLHWWHFNTGPNHSQGTDSFNTSTRKDNETVDKDYNLILRQNIYGRQSDVCTLTPSQLAPLTSGGMVHVTDSPGDGTWTITNSNGQEVGNGVCVST